MAAPHLYKSFITSTTGQYLNTPNFCHVTLEQNFEREILDFRRSGLHAEREVDDAIALGADVEMIEPDAVVR